MTNESLSVFKALFAVMSVTPTGKLSEQALADGIRLFYQQANLVPVGVGLEAVETLCAKMAFALRKLTQKFKKLWRESPQGAKLKGLAELKMRLVEAGVTVEDDDSQSSHASAEAVEELAGLNSQEKTLEENQPKIDWGWPWQRN